MRSSQKRPGLFAKAMNVFFPLSVSCSGVQYTIQSTYYKPLPQRGFIHLQNLGGRMPAEFFQQLPGFAQLRIIFPVRGTA